MKNLAELRRNAGFTQESLARALNTSASVVSKWEIGACMPSYRNLRYLKQTLNCTYDALLDE